MQNYGVARGRRRGNRGYPLSNQKVYTETIPGKVLFTDTETSEDTDGNLTLVLGCYEVWQVDDYGLPEYMTDSGDYYGTRILRHSKG